FTAHFLSTFGLGHKTIKFHPTQVFLNRNQHRVELPPENFHNALHLRTLPKPEYRIIVMKQRKFYMLMRQCYTVKLVHNMAELHIIVLQELAACRNVVEKVFYAEVRARHCLHGFLKLQSAAFNIDIGTYGGTFFFCFEFNLRYGRY